MKKGDFSRFIEETVRWRVLRQTLGEIRSGFADLSPEEGEAIVSEAVAANKNAR